MFTQILFSFVRYGGLICLALEAVLLLYFILSAALKLECSRSKRTHLHAFVYVGISAGIFLAVLAGRQLLLHVWGASSLVLKARMFGAIGYFAAYTTIHSPGGVPMSVRAASIVLLPLLIALLCIWKAFSCSGAFKRSASHK